MNRALLIAVLLLGFAPIASAAPLLDPALLNYVEHVTAGADPTSPLPLLVAVHGQGDRPEAFKRLFAQLKVPVRVILPRAPIPRGRGGTWYPQTPRAERTRVLALHTDEIARLTRALLKTRPTRGRPAVTGFSQGGRISFALAIRHPDLFAWAWPIAGALPPALYPNSSPAPSPVLAFHGTADDRIPLDGDVATVAAIRAAGGSITLKTYKNLRHHISRALRQDLFAAITAWAR